MKKGFTLVELLAVIVVLAIVSLIAIPTINNLIRKTKDDSAILGAQSYAHAIETQSITNELKGLGNIKDGVYEIGTIDVNVHGKTPKKGIITVKSGKVVDAKLCINDKSVDVIKGKAKFSDNNYCSESGKVIVYEEKSILNANSARKYEISSDSAVAICNNGGIPAISGNTLYVLSTTKDNTVCYVYSNLAEAIRHADSTKATIEVFKDNTSTGAVTVNDYKNIVLNLHNYKSNFETEDDKYHILVQGKIVINADDEGSLITNHALFNVTTNGEVILNGGKYTTMSTGENSKILNLIYSVGSVTINNANISSPGKLIPLNVGNNFTMNDGKIVGEKTSAISVATGTSTINGGLLISNTTNYNSTLAAQTKGKIIINGGTIKATGNGNGIKAYGVNTSITINNAKVYAVQGSALNSEQGTLIVNNVYAESNTGNALLTNGDSCNTTIHGGVFISRESSGLAFRGSGVNTIDQKKPIYITTLNKTNSGKPAISSNSTGATTIKGKSADNCTSNYKDTKSGLCVYAEGNKDYSSSLSQTAIYHYPDAVLNIDGGTYYGGHITLQSNSGVVNIKNANLLSHGRTLYIGSGSMYLCSNTFGIATSHLGGGESSKIYINKYTVDGTDKFVNQSKGAVDLNYTGTCNEGLSN